MKAGDIVITQHSCHNIVGIVLRIFEIDSLPEHKTVLQMVTLMTQNGIQTWKRRKLKVVSESR